jgi:uncharacterized protein YktA (UPF0223 family)
MPHIKDLRKTEMQEVIDFYYHIEEYGQIFYGDNSELDPAFKKIIEGIEDVRKIIEDYYR